jgi:hypothetical protein
MRARLHARAVRRVIFADIFDDAAAFAAFDAFSLLMMIIITRLRRRLRRQPFIIHA